MNVYMAEKNQAYDEIPVWISYLFDKPEADEAEWNGKYFSRPRDGRSLWDE